MEPKLFREAEQAAARRETATAYKLMCQVLIEDPTFVPAWVSMSKLVDDVSRQRECLERALALNPAHQAARERLEQLRVKELLSSISMFSRATSQSKTQKLGDFLVEARAITAEQLAAALTEQARRRRRGEQILLGELLLQSGMLSPEALARALVDQTLAWAPAYQRGIQNESHTVERLGDYLVAEHIITPEQLERALLDQIRLRQQGVGALLGQILVRHGSLTTRDLEQILARQRTEFFSKFD
jgi:hypothetical protein